MATATQLTVNQVPIITTDMDAIDLFTSGPSPSNEPTEEAIALANLCRAALNDLNALGEAVNPSKPYTADEIIALPLQTYRVVDELYNLPRRRGSRSELAKQIAYLLYPVGADSLTAIIRYEADRVRLRGWAALQRKFDLLKATKRNGRRTMGMTGGAAPGVQAPVWAARITQQGLWDPAKMSVSLDGVPAIPMPVQISEESDLAPFFAHLRNSGTHQITEAEEGGDLLDNGKGEPRYGVPGVEFPKGVVYADGRMDLCKMVVGPEYIWKLMDSLRDNTFVQHFLLGNNIIGPSGAQAIAAFIDDCPTHMETWYLAGNLIDGPNFQILVDAMVTSPAVTNVWMKRNPLGPAAADDVFRLVTQTPNLRTLDLDQTELGDRGVADLFNRLAEFKYTDSTENHRNTEQPAKVLPLRHIYLNGCGISTTAAAAIASFLSSPHCGLVSLYMSCNPLGDEGLKLLAEALPKAPQLARLSIQSVGAGSQGVVALCKALAASASSSSIRALDIGQAFATEDLRQAYNYIDDGAVTSLIKLVKASSTLEYLNLGHCPVTQPGLIDIAVAIQRSSSLLYYFASSIVPDPTRKAATFTPSRDLRFVDPASPTLAQIEAEKAVRDQLERNVKAKYGQHMTYADFLQNERRWIVNDKGDVRKIDSVYRNRDAGNARRGLMTLVKDWEEGDDTLARVRNAQVPLFQTVAVQIQ